MAKKDDRMSAAVAAEGEVRAVAGLDERGGDSACTGGEGRVSGDVDASEDGRSSGREGEGDRAPDEARVPEDARASEGVCVLDDVDAPVNPDPSIAQRGLRQGFVTGTRFMAAIPSAGLLIAAVTLTIRTLAEVVSVTVGVVSGGMDMQAMLVHYIECADFFLLSIVMYIMAVGLYSLFIDADVHMPEWLEIRDLDDLKEKLVGVIVVVMGVYFLGQLIHGTDTRDLLFMGLGIGAVVTALTYFVRHVISGGRRR